MGKRFDWDWAGVFLASLLFLGELAAVIISVIFLASEGFEVGRLAVLLSAAAVALYVPLAICMGKMPFAAPTEYEKRRKYAQTALGVKIPRTGDKMKGDWPLGSVQVHIEDGSDESIRVAVGRAYCLGDENLRQLRQMSLREDLKLKVELAAHKLIPPAVTMIGLSVPKELMDQSQE